MLNLKGRLFDASKLVRADIEHINELRKGKVPELNIDEMVDSHVEDRALYLLDEIETQRDNIGNLINLHLAIASSLMNKQFYWLTIIGSLLIIPTVISSIWGMNLNVPQLGFWTMMFLMTSLTVLASFVVRIFLPKPILQ